MPSRGKTGSVSYGSGSAHAAINGGPVARRHRIADHYRIVSVGCPVPGAQAALSRRSARPPVGTAYSPSTDEALERIRGLLEAGQTYGIGITFEPDGQGGWKIGTCAAWAGETWPRRTTWRLP